MKILRAQNKTYSILVLIYLVNTWTMSRYFRNVFLDLENWNLCLLKILKSKNEVFHIGIYLSTKTISRSNRILLLDGWSQAGCSANIEYQS